MERPVAEPHEPITCTVQLRAHGEVYGCRARVAARPAAHRPGQPGHGVAPGQAAVLYEGDMVIGSATIASAA